MRTTLNIDDELLEKARKMTGIEEKTALLHAGLELLIQRAASEYLASMGGSNPKFKAGRRRRSEPAKAATRKKRAG